VIVQKDLTPERLAAEIMNLAARDRGPVSAMAPTAADEIVRECRTYVQKD
jgi:hypothetical protein